MPRTNSDSVLMKHNTEINNIKFSKPGSNQNLRGMQRHAMIHFTCGSEVIYGKSLE